MTKYVEVSMNQTKKTLVQLETAIQVVAASRIKANLTKVEFETECARVERCLETQYKNSKTELDFNDFSLDFIKKYVKDLVFNATYAGDYVSDVQDVNYKEEVL